MSAVLDRVFDGLRAALASAPSTEPVAPPPAAAEATASQQATTAASPAAAAEDASEWAAKKERMRQELMSCVGNDASQQRRMLKELSDELCE